MIYLMSWTMSRVLSQLDVVTLITLVQVHHLSQWSVRSLQLFLLSRKLHMLIQPGLILQKL
jgi:hypothetical protein